VEERCRDPRYGDDQSVDDATSAYNRRALTIRHDQARGTTIDDRPEFAEEPWSAKQADALVDVVRDFLSGDSKRGRSDDHLVTVHVDQSALARGEGRSGLPVETVKRLCCDGHTVAIVENENGEPLNVGRKTRVIPKAIERALWARDMHCRVPGCRNKRYVDGHHIEHWSNGGETSLDNLLLLCTRHHRLVHEGGFRIDKDYLDRWTFYRSDGIAVPHHGFRAEDMTDDEIASTVNNPPRGGLLSDVEKKVMSSSPPR
jgi:hypothetical protein